MVDAEGNAADDILLVVHVENDHLPLFEFYGGWGVPLSGKAKSRSGRLVRPSMWLARVDFDGVADAELLLIRSDETVVWSAETPGKRVPSIFHRRGGAGRRCRGEYHFEMEAVDGPVSTCTLDSTGGRVTASRGPPFQPCSSVFSWGFLLGFVGLLQLMHAVGRFVNESARGAGGS